MFKVEHFTLTDSDTTAMGVSLSSMPGSNVALDIIHGTSQHDRTSFTVSPDFRVDGTFVAWDSTDYALYSQLETGDRIRVIYDQT